MASPIKTYTTAQIKSEFARELGILANDDSTSKYKIEMIVKEILREGDIKPLLTTIPENLRGRATGLYNIFTWPLLKVSPETKDFLKTTLEQTLSTLRNERLNRNFTSLWKDLIPAYRIPIFKATLDGFFAKGRNEGMDVNQAILFASAKALAYLTVTPPTSAFITRDPDLQERINDDPCLAAYQCQIALDIPIEDAVYLEHTDDKGQTHKHYYHDSVICNWIVVHGGRDPITDKPIDLKDIKEIDQETRDLINNRLISLTYPELTPDFPPIEGLKANSIRFLLLMKVSYLQVTAYSERFLAGEPDPHRRIAEIERFAGDSVSKLGQITAAVKFNWEDIPAECLPYIEMFINTEGSKDISAAEAARNLQQKIEIFMAIFPEIQGFRMASSTKTTIINRASEIINQGADLTSTRALISELTSVVSLEDGIRTWFPDCLRGAKEWAASGAIVDDVPIPEGMLDILQEPSINIEGFPEGSKVGETHMLVLMPEKVNGVEFSFKEAEALFDHSGVSGANVAFDDSDRDSHKKAFNNSYWALIPKGVLKESNNKPYEEQITMVDTLPNRGREPAAVSRIFELTVAVCLEKIVSGTKLFTERHQRCEKSLDHTRILWMVPQESSGIYITSVTESRPSKKSYIGVVWRFQPGP